MRILVATLLALLPLSGAAASTPRVEHLEFTSGDRAAQPSVAVDVREGFVLTWQERVGAQAALHYAVIDSKGQEQRRGEIAHGPDWFVNGADFPSLAVLDNGDWISFYLRKTAPDTYAYAVHLVRSRDAGKHWEAPVVIHRDGTDTEHGFVSLVAAGGDRVRAVWLDGRRMAGKTGEHEGAEHMTLRSALLGRKGVPTEEAELDDLTCACCQTAALRLGARTVVAYRDRSAAEQRDIHVVVQADGAWSAPRPLHADGWTIAACPVNGAALTGQGTRIAALWPTMANREMRVLTALASDDADFAAPVELAAGPDELGRVDIAPWVDDTWLATRVASIEGKPSLLLSVLDADGHPQAQQQVAVKVGGYPRLAVHRGIALVAWAEAGEAAGQSRIGLARVSIDSPN